MFAGITGMAVASVLHENLEIEKARSEMPPEMFTEWMDRRREFYDSMAAKPEPRKNDCEGLGIVAFMLGLAIGS